MKRMSDGPLRHVRVLEMAGLGPTPFCGMSLADLGADVVRVDPPGGQLGFVPPELELMNRGKRSIMADLKDPADVDTVLALAEHADIMIEGFRPGVAERLGIGPAECLKRRPLLVYGRMTGSGQTGPLAKTAGHDIDYIALAGALHAIGPADGPPSIPPGLIGDFAGGAYLTLGLLAALHHAQVAGEGQVVDAAMVDSAAHMMTMFYGLFAGGAWRDQRGTNLVDGGSPFYRCYATADGEYMAVGAVEPQFFAELTLRLGLDTDLDHFDRENWPTLTEQIAAAFATRTRAHWIELFDGTDACVAPVLSMSEASKHPHLTERKTFIENDGVAQPAPAPRFSRTPTSVQRRPCLPGQHTDEILDDWLKGVSTPTS